MNFRLIRRLCILGLAVTSIWAGATASAQDLGKELLAWEMEVTQSTLSQDEFVAIDRLLFPPPEAEGWIELRRDPSFGYPTRLVITMGSKSTALAYSIANPIVIPDRAVSLNEHLEFLASKNKTSDAGQLAKHIVINERTLDAAQFKPYLDRLEKLRLAPKFNRTDSFVIGTDGTVYSVKIKDLNSSYEFQSGTASDHTPDQKQFQELLKKMRAIAFPSVDFNSAR